MKGTKKKSGFKLKLRLIALVLLCVLIPQQVVAKSNKGSKPDLSDLFKEPSTGDMLLGLGISLGSCLVVGKFGSMFGNTKFGFNEAVMSLGEGMFKAQIVQAATTLGVYQFKMKPSTAQIFGYGMSGALTGISTSLAAGGPQFTSFEKLFGKGLGSFMNKHYVFSGTMMDTFKGMAMGAGSAMAYDTLKNTSLYQKNPMVAQQLASLIGGVGGYLGFTTLTAMSGIQQSWIDPNTAQRISVGGKEFKDMGLFARAWAGLKTPILKDTMFKSSLISQGVALGVEWAAGPKYAQYSRLLGQSIGSMVSGKLFSGQEQLTWRQAAVDGALSGLSSWALSSLGGEFDQRTGKNHWGLTPLQMASVNYAWTTLARQRLLKESQLGEFAIDYVTWGGTSPLFTRGAGGWSETQHIEKIAQFAGISDFKANADYALKVSGYHSWREFVKDGNLDKILPSLSYSLVNYAQSNLHYAAVGNLSALIKDKVGNNMLVTIEKIPMGDKADERAHAVTADTGGIPMEKISELPPNVKFIPSDLVNSVPGVSDEVIKGMENLLDILLPPKEKKGDYYKITRIYRPGLFALFGLGPGFEPNEKIYQQIVNAKPWQLSLGLYQPIVSSKKAIQEYQPLASKDKHFLKFWEVISYVSGDSPRLISTIPVAILDSKHRRAAQNGVEDWIKLLQPAVEKWISENQQDAAKFVIKQFDNNDVVLWGENHASHRQDSALVDVLSQWADSGKKGNRYLFLETAKEHQNIISNFMATGDSATLEKELKKYYDDYAINNYEIEQIKVAREKGIKVICMDMSIGEGDFRERDKVMAETVQGTLNTDPDAKILVQVGMRHTAYTRTIPLMPALSTVANPLQHRLQQLNIEVTSIGLGDGNASFFGVNNPTEDNWFSPEILKYSNAAVPFPRTGVEDNITRLFLYLKNPLIGLHDNTVYFKKNDNK